MFKKICFGLIIGFAVLSCKEVVYKPTGVADANIIAVVTDNDTLFGLGLHTYSSWEFSEVTAYLYGDTVIYTLNPFNALKTDMSYETPIGQMKHQLPKSGTYNFDVSFTDNSFMTLSDLLTSQYILPPPIVRCEYSSTLHQVVVEWGNMVNAEKLNIRLFNQQGELLYMSPTLNKSLTLFTFGIQNEGWQNNTYPVQGQKITLQVSSFLFDNEVESGMSIQATGRIEKTITWGN